MKTYRSGGSFRRSAAPLYAAKKSTPFSFAYGTDTAAVAEPKLPTRPNTFRLSTRSFTAARVRAGS